MAVQPPWPPSQLTDGELKRRREEILGSIALLPTTSGRVDTLRAELAQIEAEQQTSYRLERRGAGTAGGA
jgi:hypothetical protein